MIACFTESAGAMFLGKHVTETVRKGIADVNAFKDEPEVRMLGMLLPLVVVVLLLWRRLRCCSSCSRHGRSCSC